MFFRVVLIPVCFCISTTALAVLKWQKYPCGLNQPTIYDSALLVEGESLHLSCSICEQCEPKLAECSPGFSITKYIKLSKTNAKAKNFAEVEVTDALSIRERVRSRLYFTENIQNLTHKGNSSSGSAWELIKNHTIPSLNIYYTIEKPSKAPEKMTFTKTRFYQPRVFVYKDQLVLRKGLAQDTGVYTCVYRGRPRIVWAVTVLPPGVEPYRQTIAPMVNLKLGQVDIDPPQNLRTLNQKTVSHSNVQVRLFDDLSLTYQMFTSWGPWSECVPCVAQLPAGSQGFKSKELGGEGFQMRVGTCYVRMVDSFLPLKPYKLAFHATKSLKQFGQAGLPCRSHLIELGVQNSGIIPLLKRPSELIIRPCYKPCPAPANTNFYTFLANSRGMTNDSAEDASNDVSKPETKEIHVKDGDRYIISCPIRGTAHSPVSWFHLPVESDNASELIQSALSPKAFMAFGTASGWLAYHATQVNLTTLLKRSRGRISIDPAYHLIYAEARSSLDCSYEKGDRFFRKPSFRLGCVHGDARGSNIKWSDWSGVIVIKALVRWTQLEILTGFSTATAVLMPALIALITIVLSIKCLMDERKPKLKAAAVGRTQRPNI